MYKLVLADFPFTEKIITKKRPVLLLTDGSYGKHKIIVIAYITSRDSEGILSEIKIKKSSQNKLEKDSIIKLHKIANIPQSAVRGELGTLTDKESKEVKTKLKTLFGL
jgi:mRNA-degrading endonuclease toxin of MazEF toxin-antitoxin module